MHITSGINQGSFLKFPRNYHLHVNIFFIFTFFSKSLVIYFNIYLYILHITHSTQNNYTVIYFHFNDPLKY